MGVAKACRYCARRLTAGPRCLNEDCESHAKRREQALRKQNYSNPRWRRTRRAFLAAYPDCERCGDKATDVHHLDGRGHQGPLGHDFTNLQALCHSCHSQITAREHGLGGAH